MISVLLVRWMTQKTVGDETIYFNCEFQKTIFDLNFKEISV